MQPAGRVPEGQPNSPVTMSDRKASNKYYPPGFDPRKGSLNMQQGQHPLRDRARKLDQGILIIRFEAPWHFWCGGCGAHIGRGVRWNAEKKRVGHYYTTPIYSFTMKCHLCPNRFTFETDPKNCDYRITVGARRKNETFDAAENGTIEIPDAAEISRRAEDPMYRLEHGAADEERAARKRPRMAQLMQLKASTTQNDYGANAQLRQRFRRDKADLDKANRDDAALLAKASLPETLSLQKEAPEDVARAKTVRFGRDDTHDGPGSQLAKRNRRVKAQSIFQDVGSSQRVSAAGAPASPRRTGASTHARAHRGLSTAAAQLLAKMRAPPRNASPTTVGKSARAAPLVAVRASRAQARASTLTRGCDAEFATPVEPSLPAGQSPAKRGAGGLVVDYGSSSESDQELPVN